MKMIQILAVSALIALFSIAAFAQRSFIAIDVPLTENFDTLARSGSDIAWQDNSTITGVYASREVYHAGNGSMGAGTIWSFGSTGSTERALGSSASLQQPLLRFGVRISNDTGVAITSIEVQFFGEQWRSGGNTATHKLTFDFAQAAQFSNLTDGKYTSVNQLDFASLVNTTSSGALNGNLPEHRSLRSASIPVNIPPGEEIMLRWTDIDDPGHDHGLGVDDLIVIPLHAPRTYVVDTLSDDVVLSGCTDVPDDCSLRGAISIAADGDTIEFDIPAPFGAPQTLVLTGGTEIVVASDVVISGPGADMLTIDGGPGANRLFFIDVSTVEITDLTVSGGDGVGAAMSTHGGAIYATGSLTLDRMHFTGNTANSGGAARFDSGNHFVRNSTFSGNTALSCGAIFNFTASSLVIENTTISGNSIAAGNAGGAICSDGTGASMLLSNSTVTGNQSPSFAGGIFNDNAALTIRSSIIAGNSAPSRPEIWFASGTLTSLGFNLIGDSSGDSTDTANTILYQTTDILNVDPRLGPLADNGGPTPTHRLYATSPAIDKGNSFGLANDQRGLARIYNFPTPDAGDGADIGAFENLGPTAATVSLSGRVRTAKGLPIRNASVTIFGGDLAQPVSISTGSFGSYSFNNLRAGQTYFVMVSAGRYTFIEPLRTVVPVDNVDDLDFVAN